DGVATGMVDLAWPAGGPGRLSPSSPASPPAAAPGTLQVEHTGSGRPWATVRALAAVPLREPIAAGYRVRRSVTPVEQAVAGKWSRGDTYRVRLDVEAQADMTWVVVSDPVPTGATILGSGLGRDSAIATRGQGAGTSYATFTERTPEAYRAYYAYVPKGGFAVEYTVRLNNAGEFAMPPARVEAMYAPDVFGALPVERLTVGARP
ncbi:alpha-2-macroglobulin family protein, partial [Cupriavidus sp. Marseille-Q8015]